MRKIQTAKGTLKPFSGIFRVAFCKTFRFKTSRSKFVLQTRRSKAFSCRLGRRARSLAEA